MRVSVFGLGYAGSVSAACFAAQGHSVIGVDPNRAKIDRVNAGAAPMAEPELDTIIARAVKDNLLSATADAGMAVLKSDISFICVGTPGHDDGSVDTRHLENACREIGAALARKNSFHVVTVRSTLLPGTTRTKIVPMLESLTSRKAGVDFGVCHNPEFLREGTAVHDFYHPSKIVIGASDVRSGDIVQDIYAGLPGPVIRCSPEASEMVKYADNAWHAVKIAFGNEIGKFCKASGIDSHAVMDIFCRDTKLNLSAAYLNPGFAFGGSCLPKDLRALTHQARARGVELPLLDALLPSNRAQIEAGIEMILATGKKRVGILGFSFKYGTDDLRESPMLEVIHRLDDAGYDLKLYDRSIDRARLMGAHHEHVLKKLPHLERLITTRIEDVLAHAETIVIGTNDPEFARIAEWLRPEQRVVDFVRVGAVERAHANYNGICW